MSNTSLVIALIFSVFIFYDMKRRGYSPFLAIGMVLISFVLPILILPIYLILAVTGKAKVFRSTSRPTQSRLETPQICSKCGHENTARLTECSACHNNLRLDG